MRQLVFAILFTIFSVPSGHAEIFLDEFQDLLKKAETDDKSRASAAFYLQGLSDAMQAMNVFIKEDLGSRVYCPPPDLKLDVNKFYNIFVGELENPLEGNEYKLEHPISIIAVFSMRHAYPCQ